GSAACPGPSTTGRHPSGNSRADGRQHAAVQSAKRRALLAERADVHPGHRDGRWKPGLVFAEGTAGRIDEKDVPPVHQEGAPTADRLTPCRQLFPLSPCSPKQNSNGGSERPKLT